MFADDSGLRAVCARGTAAGGAAVADEGGIPALLGVGPPWGDRVVRRGGAQRRTGRSTAIHVFISGAVHVLI